MPLASIRLLFAIAGMYDCVLGLAFLFIGPRIFTTAGVTHPNHWGYVQFGALLLVIFGLMFFAIARDPIANRNLMPYGMLLKLSYAGLVAYYWIAGNCAQLFKPFAVIDAVMLILFAVAYRQARRTD